MVRWMGGKAKANSCITSLTLLSPKPTTEVEATNIPALLEREDCTLAAWYSCLYAPRTGGAYDSHHRTAGIAGRTRRRGGRVVARGARAAAGDADDRRSRRGNGLGLEPVGNRLYPAAARARLDRGPHRRNRISLGGRTQRAFPRAGG